MLQLLTNQKAGQSKESGGRAARRACFAAAFALVPVWLMATGFAQAADEPTATTTGFRPLDLPYGATALDIDGDGQEDLAIRSWRDNGNASGYDVYQFVIRTEEASPTFVEERRGRERAGTLWQTVMIQDEGGNFFQPTVEERQSGACTLRSVRLVRAVSEDLTSLLLIVAEKEKSRDALTAVPVNLRFYSLSANADDLPGRPAWSFTPQQSVRTNDSFCDTDKAIDAVLGPVLETSKPE